MKEDDGFWVDVQLDRPRRLRFTIEGLHSMEEDLGGPLGPKGGVGRLRVMLRAALLHENRKLSLQDTMKIMEQAPGETITEKLKYLSDKVELALELALGKEAVEESKKKLAEAGIPALFGAESAEPAFSSLVSSPGRSSE